MDQTEGLKRVDNHVKLCSECEKRPAVTLIRRRIVKAKRHDLCRQCFQSDRDSRRNETETANQENIAQEIERIIWERFLAKPQLHD